MYVRKTVADSRKWNFGNVGLHKQQKSGAPAQFSVYLEKLKPYGKCILNIKSASRFSLQPLFHRLFIFYKCLKNYTQDARRKTCRSLRKIQVIFVLFQPNLQLSTNYSNTLDYQISLKFVQWFSSLYIWTDVPTVLDAFLQLLFAKKIVRKIKYAN